ncbi:C10 family peptidase [candidate division WOR-3 bacterium]|nr:C10 family peptidase [candidate division WOR-3 bacterium]
MCKFKVMAVLLLVSLLAAKLVDPEAALKVASSQMHVMSSRLAQTNCLSGEFAIPSDASKPLYDEAGDEILAYVFDFESQGFVVVTADDDLVPVIAYSEHGSFPWEEHPENILLNMLRQDLSVRIEALPLTDEEVIERNHRLWEGMIAGDPAFLDPGDSWPEAGSTETGGWVETLWHQGWPYNTSCPMDPVTDARCQAGCPSVAMGQIINFWQYPSSVIFTEQDSYTSEYLGRTIPIDAPAASIPSIDYNNGDPSDEVSAALIYACGVGTKTVYTSQISGVFTNDVCADALLEHFDYSSAVYREGDGGDFYSVLEQNMKDSMPAIIVIVGEPGGHTLVCDGFRETEADPEWHMNFGWGASLPAPVLETWYVMPGGLPMGLTTLHEAIVDIAAPHRPVSGIIEQPETGRSRLECSIVQSSDYTSIHYHLPHSTYVVIKVWDAAGRCVQVLANQTKVQGEHCIIWDGRDEGGSRISNGCYFINLRTNESCLTQRVVFIK